MPKKPQNDLRAFIAACECVTCRALTSLKVIAGANILISRTNTGRMCEMAVVAAAGEYGLGGDEVVERRAAYARHLKVELLARNRRRPAPVHIAFAIKHSNHTPGKSNKNFVNLGRANATYNNGRYRLLWNTETVSAQRDTPPVDYAGASDNRADAVKYGIAIDWPEGPELIELDLQDLGLHTVVTQTVQQITNPSLTYRYNTTSSIETAPDGTFCLTIGYAHEDNKHINENDSSWGHTTIVLHQGDIAGTINWTHAGAKVSGDDYPFYAANWRGNGECVQNDDAEEDEHGRRADEEEIESRTDLTATQKDQMIKARRGQGKFRARVLRMEPRCRVTGIDDTNHLRASHIKPWAACENDADRLDGNNGLMLAPHIDHLFDRAYISFHDDGTLLVSRDTAVQELFKAWGIGHAVLKPHPFNAKQQAFLAVHRKLLRSRQNRGNA